MAISHQLYHTDLLRIVFRGVGNRKNDHPEKFAFLTETSTANLQLCTTSAHLYYRFEAAVTRRVSDPKDHVYAPYKIWNEIGVRLPGPDYSLPVATIYQDTSISVISVSRSLSGLLLVPSGNRRMDLPFLGSLSTAIAPVRFFIWSGTILPDHPSKKVTTPSLSAGG